MSRTWTQCWMLSLALGAATREAGAQQIVSAERAAEATDTLVLARPVTIQLQQMSLREAVIAVGAAAHVQVAYHRELLDAVTHPVTLQVKNMPLGKALEQLLAGTQLVVVPVQRDIVSIVRGSAAEQKSLGAVAGIVTDATTKRGVADATVSIDGTKVGVRTGNDGGFRIGGLTAGTYRVVVRRIGYQASSIPVTITDDSTRTIFVALVPAATTLTDVVTTATGERRRMEVGNAVGTIKADSVVATTLIRNVSDLLQARVPGVVVANTDGAVGAPSKIRLRGVNSLALNNDPIVIVDGVRLNAQSTVASLQTNVGSPKMIGQLDNPTGGAQVVPLAPSRLDDIDPNTIESIDVLRGPSASSLYGTDAANGVIVIKTKKGRAGAWRLNVTGESGESHIPGSLPDNWVGWGRQNGNQETSACTLATGGITVIGGGCVQDSITHFNPENYGPMSTFGTGTSRSASANLSGGTTALQQFLSARIKSDVGIAKMSEVNQRIIDRYWSVPAPSWMVHPNAEQDVDGSAQTTVNVSPAVDVSLSMNGLYRNVLNGGSGVQAVGPLSGLSPLDTLGYLPSDGQRTQVTSNENRGTLATTANARPWHWLSLTGTAGGDYGLRTDESNLGAQYCTAALIQVRNNSSVCPSGRSIARGETFITTANSSASLSFSPLSWINLRTVAGEQYSHTRFYNLRVGNSDPRFCPLQFGSTLLSPTPTCPPGWQAFSVDESRDEAATAGIYAEETVTAFGMFYTFGVRRDLASAFGSQVTNSPPKFPKINLSYPVSEQSYFPKQPYVTSLRLRLAYGQSGNQASRSAVLNNYVGYDRTSNNGTTSTPVVSVSNLGNVDLKPEKSTEWEGGADVSFLDNERVHVEFTLYRKFTRDMITSIPLTPSLGSYNLFYNLGNVENRGLEVGLTAKLLDTRAINWDLNINGAKNTNKLVHKSPTLPPYGPVQTQFVEGYPLFGFWGVPIVSYTDRNGDGILAQDEVIYGPMEFMGASSPKGTVTYGSTVAILNGALRFSANLYQVIGQTTSLAVNNQFAPRAAVDRTAPLAEQAAFLEAVANDNRYLGASSSVRLNEMSVTYSVPVSFAQRLHAQSFAITIAGRNLALWSNYAGKDPNVDTSGLLGEAAQDDGYGTPQPRLWTLRFNLGL